jgi:hypothetical protein
LVHREGKVTLIDPDLFRLPNLRIGITQQMLQSITLGGAMIAFPIFLQISLIPVVPRADSGWYLLIPLVVAGAGLGLLVSQLNNYPLAPIDQERISEAAGVNSAAGSFALSFGLVMAAG